MWWDKITIKLCLKCGKSFSTNKVNLDKFCSEECQEEFEKIRNKYIFSKEERYLIREIKEHSY